MDEKIIAAADRGCFFEYGFLDVAGIKFYPQVVQICKETCRHYDASWACPPAIGTYEECVERVLGYERMFLFSKLYEMEDSFDFRAIETGLADFREEITALDRQLKTFLPDYLLLSAEGCTKCEKCTYPDEPCAYPDELFPALEGYGFNVNQLANAAGMSYNNGFGVITFFGGVLFRTGEV
ncbi:MAG: DUF2284 domain-containing protein [Lachnospiraceae bacterium]|nr:DUF2284 domain-containing protein [Lachnospiraceae bacterium]